MKKFYKILLVNLIIFGSLLLTSNSLAAIDHPDFRDSTYQAKYYNQSVADPIKIEAGSTKEVIIRFKNTGNKTWLETNWGYVSVYTFNKKYRDSLFANSDWLSKDNPTKVSKNTKPGEIGEFRIKVTAPSKAGSYKEEFYLASENTTWIKGGYFYLQFTVTLAKEVKKISVNYNFTKQLSLGSKGEEVTKLQTLLKELGHYTYPSITGYYGSLTKEAVIKFQTANKLSTPGVVGPQTRAKLNLLAKQKQEVVNPPAGGEIKTDNKIVIVTTTDKVVSVIDYKAELFSASSKKVNIDGGEKVKMQLMFKNIGDKDWDGYQLRLLGVYGDSKEVIVSHEDWPTDQKVINSTEVVRPKQTANLDFYFRAPHLMGEYKLKFKLISNNKSIANSTFILPVTATGSAGPSYVPDIRMPDRDGRGLIDEENIRVGLYKVTKPVNFKSKFPYLIYIGEIKKGELPANTVATLSYINGKYNFSGGGEIFTAIEPIRLVAKDQTSYYTITNYTRKVGWRKDINYNSYRGNLEIKATQAKKIPYIVNELPLSNYMAGIAETSNGSHLEYSKAVLVAARSYAYHKIHNGMPKDKRTFDVYGSTIDQLYLGYNSEVVMPNIVKSAVDTFGEMVTYQGEVVTTPYFGHSDGSTRTWSEVWGGTDKPWLKRVEATYDKGLSMFGHGVGMSNRDASFRATKDGWNYEQILKYYYTGVEVEQIY
jgi:hypothetical protein